MNELKQTTNLAEELMNVEECAAYIGVTVNRIRKLCHYKQIPYMKMGKFVRFYRPDINKWVLSKRVA